MKIGDPVGIGYYIDSCLNCEFCKNGQESMCINGVTNTSGGVIKVNEILIN